MITLAAATLAAALKSAASVTESRNTIPILSNAMLRISDDSLEIVTTDLDCELRQRLAVDVAGPLDITVDAHRLSAIAGAANKGAQISLEMDDRRLVVKTGRSRFVLPTLPCDDFPKMPEPNLAASLEIGGQVLGSALSRVSPSISTEQTKYYLNGALLNAEAGKLRLTSTDGHRCTSVDCDVSWPDGAAEVIVPTKAVRLIQQLFEGSQSLQLAWDDRKLRAWAGDVTFTSKTIDGTFPDYRRIVPAANDAPIRVEPEGLRAALRRTTLVETGKTRSVKVESRDGLLVISTTDPDGGQACEEVPAECGGGYVAGFNAAYLTSAVEVIGGDTVELHHADPLAPCLIRRTTGGDASITLMPMRV